MPSLRLNIGLNGGRKLPFGGAAPSDISLTAPIIYLSGLTLTDGAVFYNPILYSPYTLSTTGIWVDPNSFTGYVGYFGTWVLNVYALADGNPESARVATNTAPATSLPTTGWVNTQEDLTVSGTLVISTTP